MIAQVNFEVKQPKPNSRADNELDSNADTCCLGSNFVILNYTRRVADVYSYDKSSKPIENVPIVSGATAYDDPSGKTYILIVNEGLYYGEKLDHSLINPNQVRQYGIPLWDNPYDKDRMLGMEVYDNMSIPFQTRGTKIFFNTRAPTQEELADTASYIHLTGDTAWNPEHVSLGELGSSHAKDGGNEEIHDTRITDEDLLHSIEPSLIHLPSRMISYVKSEGTYDPNLLPARSTLISTERHSKITANKLSEYFGIGQKRAESTLRCTLQNGVRSAILPLSRRYYGDRRFEVRRLKGKFATDTLYGPVKSLNQYIGSQIYSHKCGLAVPYHMQRINGENIGTSLSNFIHEYGVPEKLTSDGAKAQVGTNTKFVNLIRQHKIDHHVSAPRRPNENPAEGAIREIKKRYYRIQTKYDVPDRLWDYTISYVCETGNITANSSRYSNSRCPLEIITGDTPEISEYLDFPYYGWVTFRQNAGLGPLELGRWLGVSHRVGPMMSYWILPSSGIPISCTTVQNLTYLEQQTDEWKRKMEAFSRGLDDKWKAQSAQLPDPRLGERDQKRMLNIHLEDEDFLMEYNRVINNSDILDEDDKAYDPNYEAENYLNMELSLRRGDDGTDAEHAVVKRRAIDVDGRPIGVAHSNPLMDSRRYEVEYDDGTTEIMAANVIAENLLAQVDEEGRRQMMIDEIIDHRSDPKIAIPKEQGRFISHSGQYRKKKTTRGWELCVLWKDGSTDWIALKDLKESYPIQVAQYAKNVKIDDEPAFAWWVDFVTKKRDSIIQKVKSKYWSRTHKYGIRVPKSVKEAEEIDDENGNTLWMDSVRLEMKNVMVAFEKFEGDVNDLKGYDEITGHLIFDVKLAENFRRKARFVADGHKTKHPNAVTYSTVVARDSVRIMLLIASLNDLDIRGADIQNAFLTAPNREKNFLKAGPEFGEFQGTVFIVTRALYGLRSAAASFRAYLAEHLDDMGFTSCHADPDVWRRPAVKSNGETYFEYFLTYVDDILAISEDPVTILKDVNRTFKFKNDAIEVPDIYLGAKMQMKMIDGRKIWTISSLDYVKAAIANIEEACKSRNWELPTKCDPPMSSDFIPEFDDSPELKEKDVTWYQEMIGILRWASEIGRVDILTEISQLSQYQASPREGHLRQLLRIFAYMKKKPKISLHFDPNLPNIDYTQFRTKHHEFLDLYRDAHEMLPCDYVEPRGKPVTMTAFSDASFATNKKNRRSHSGYIIFLNRAPIMWYSKRQTTVESSTFSSEFLALKVCTGAIQNLRFKLRSFGIPIINDEPCYIFCDNEGCVKNTTAVESKMDRKHSAVAYHFVRYAVAAGIISISWIPTKENLADLFTKRLPKDQRDYLLGNFTY